MQHVSRRNLLLMLVGFACACLSDHPMQALERALSAIPSLPPVAVIWTFVGSLLATGIAIGTRRLPVGRASPALLQCFLF